MKITERTGDTWEHRSAGQAVIALDWTRRVARVARLAVAPPPAGPRVYHRGNCEPVFVHRQDPAGASAAGDVVFPQNYAFWLATSEAHIVGADVVAGRKATVIEGRHDPYLADKLGAVRFQMWIDDLTGVLLKLVGSDERDAVVYFVEVKDIQFDRGVDVGRFSVTAPAGFRVVPPEP